MPNTIKVKRGKSAALNSSTEKLQAGEVLYNLDKNYLTVGANDNDALTKKPVAAREIVGYTGDTDDKIGASTIEAYSIKYDNNSGVVVRSENNILSTPDTIEMRARGKEGNTLTINTGEVYTDAADNPTIEISSVHGGTQTLTIPRKTGTLATTDDITASAATKLDNTNEDKVALKNNKSLSYTSNATASTIMSRDANGRAKVADGAADQDIATVGQLNTGLNTKVTRPANPTADSVLSILKDGSIGSIPQIKYITLTGTSGTLTADQLSTLNENIKYNFIIKETRQAGGYVQSKIFRPIQVYNEIDEDVDFAYAHIDLDISEIIGISGNSWHYSSWKLSNDKVVEVSSVDADSGTLTTQQNNDLLDRRTLLLLHGEYYYFIGDLTHAETKIFNSYVSYGKGANDSLQIKIVTIDENTSPNTWVRITYDLGNYYTKTESDGRYVKQTTGHNKVYATDSTGTDSELGYSQSPANSTIVQYSSSGTLRTNTPTVDLDAVNMGYGEGNYYQLDRGIYLPENADLNNYKAPGTYKANPQVAGTVINAPKGSSFFTLFVSTNPGTEVITQLLYSYSHIFTRSYATSWSDWEELATKTDLKDYYILNGGTYTTEGGTTTDFNTLTTPGVYDIGPGEKVNGPLDSGAPVRLVVETFYKSDTIIFQTFISYDVEFTNTNCQYHRMYRGATEGWGEWHQVATTEYVDNGFVKSVASTVNQYSVYAIGKNKDITITLAENPDAQAVVQYSSAGTLKTNNPTADLDAVNKKYGDSKYFNKAEIELTPTTGDTVSREQIMDLDTGLYGIFGHKIYGLDISGYFNLEIFHSSAHRTYLLESSNNDVYMAQILNDTDRTFTGWIQLATASDINNKKVFSVTIYEAGD